MLQNMQSSAMNSQVDPLVGNIANPQTWFSNIGFLEIVDLVLTIGILIALCFYLMRRRAGKMILGGGFVFAFLTAAILLGFPFLGAFAKNVFSFFLLVLLIIFHDEIRDVLRQIGCIPEKIGAFFKKRSAPGISKKTGHVIDEVCDAAAQMSESRTGALMVLRRASGLREYTAKGKILNAEVSSALIRTIFYNGSPLHDGAMIIENGRIRATGCQLPPADPEGLDDSLGERHKAAIGISECTDAVAVVVSEETGTISIALGDELKRGYSREELHTELTALLGNYNTKLVDWEEGSSLTVSTVRKHKKPEKEKTHGKNEEK
jgi:diadenylate cyclase